MMSLVLATAVGVFVQQSHHTLPIQGNGRGLSIAQRMLEASGGNGTVESELGQRTTFPCCLLNSSESMSHRNAFLLPFFTPFAKLATLSQP